MKSSTRLPDSVYETVLNINSVLQNTKIGKIMAKKLEEIMNKSEKIIQENIDWLGQQVVDDIKREARANADDSGRTYAYINENGDIVEEFTSSSAGNYPAAYTHTLIDNIEYMAGYGTLHFGVWSQDPGPRHGTKYYIGLEKDSYRKYITERFGKDETYYDNYHGLIMIGDHKTPVEEYARILQKGVGRVAARPFIRSEVIKESIKVHKKIFYEMMKSKLKTRVKRKTIPVYFRITIED